MMYSFSGWLLDVDARELRSDTGLVHLEQQVFDVLLYLVEHRARVVSKNDLLDAVWGDRFVSVSAITSRIKSARSALGDSGAKQNFIKTVHGVGYRFVADDVSIIGDELVPPVDGGPDSVVTPWVMSQPEAAQEIEQKIRFVEAADGLSLAMVETGQGPCLVKAATFLTQVDKDTSGSPIWGHWVRGLSRNHRYVRYDPRGCGLSDRNLDGTDLTDLELWIDDLERVIDQLGDDRVALLGISQGGPVAIGYAARRPERVSHLILSGTYSRGMRRRSDSTELDRAGLQVNLAKIGWETDNEEFQQVFARQFVPGAQSDEIRWFSDQLRLTTNGTNAPQLEAAFHDLDVSHLARQLEVPTLVFHALGDRVVPFEEGRRMAGQIPGARFVPLESKNHVLMQRDAAFAVFLREVTAFTSA